jgi:hypothetical protein
MANKRGKSEKKTTFWGKEYVQHYDSKGNKRGRSEQKETFFGKKYTQHYDTKGEKRGHSEKKETWTGRQYTQKYNASGEKSGRSEKKTGFFGNKYTQHYDREGQKSDWTERKETFFGKKYNQRYGDEPSSRSSASSGPGNTSKSYGGTYGSSGATSYARSSYASPPSASAGGSSSIRPGAVIGLLIAAGLVVGLISLIGNLRGSRRLNSDGPQSLGNAYINTLQLNVRRGPGTDYGVVTRLTKGTLVACLERSTNAHGENWLKIRSESLEGWVNEEYLSRNSPVADDARAPSTVQESSPNEVQAQTQLNRPQDEPINRDDRLPAPRLLAPGDGAVMSYYPRRLTMEWESVPGADTYTVEIQFQGGGSTWNDLTEFLNNNGYVGYVEPVKLSDTRYSLNWIGINPGRWRVWAVDRDQKAGRKSEWREFRFTR